jgi:hypothetical protein
MWVWLDPWILCIGLPAAAFLSSYLGFSFRFFVWFPAYSPSLWLDASGTYACCIVFPFFLLVMLFRRYRPSFVRRQSSSILATLLFFLYLLSLCPALP